MGSDHTGANDSFREFMGWDADLEIVEDRLGAVTAAVLGAPIRAFLFNLRAVDRLLLSPFLIAADGVQLFYWTLQYVRAGNTRLISILNGDMPLEAFDSDRAGQITEANSYMRERVDQPHALAEFAEQIDASLRRLIEREDFKTAMRVQLLASVVLLWTAYETLRNDLLLIGKTYSVPTGMFDLSDPEADLLTEVKEYRNVIVHRAAVVDDRFVVRVKRQRPGEQLEVNSELASRFFNSIATIGTHMLLVVDRHIENNPLAQ